MKEYREEIQEDSLILIVSDEMNQILRANLYEVGLNEKELKRLRIRKRELREALNNCGIGDAQAKLYVKNVIEDILVNKLKYGEESWNRIIPFQENNRLSSRDKFDILMYCYEEKYGCQAFERFISENNILEKISKEDQGYCMDQKMIEDIFFEKAEVLSAEDKKKIIVQRLYAGYRGLGVVDQLRDFRIDGISGGVSGKEGEYNSVWVFFHGITMHLKFLSFQTERELERVCMNIYRYGNPGQLSKTKGYIVNEMKDHSRVVVVRPPFSESFAFFVRKFDTMERKEMEELITDPGNEIVIEHLKWIVKGCQITAVTGAQGTGKTTLLMGLIAYIHPAFTLRIQEMAFELHLRDTYPERNILSFRETDTISGQEGLDLQKKTDGVVNILGEVASIEVAAYLIQMSQVGSLFTLFTHHAKTTESLVKYMRNSLLSSGLFRNEKIAREQVVDSIRFDVHLEKDIKGHRYVERISEIVPQETEKGYSVVDIVKYENGRYVQTGRFSDDVIRDMRKRMTESDKEEFGEKYNL
ncbi:MAG: pilus assembly protein CpaF [Lachnospiraceae bacterium]|nr:pilus assembly protein CpaF [Lachnospiraceae bacterium]